MGVFTTQGYRGKLVDKLTGTILDTFADEDILVSNNILDLFDLGEIPGTYTQTLTLPGTKVNNSFFEHYYDISVWEPDIFNTNQVVEAYLDFDSFYLVNGYLQLNKVNVIANKFVDSYEVTLFGIISNFSIDTRTSFLTDLTSLNVYNHTSSYYNISESWNRRLFDGDIVYPMAEYGQQIYYSNITFLGIDDAEGSLSVQDYKPAIRVKKVWDAIFQEFGYTYTGSFWNEPWLDDVYMICNNDLKTPVYQPSIETFGQGRVTNITGSATQSLSAGVTASWAFNAKEFDYDNKFTIGSSLIYSSSLKTTLNCKLDLAFEVTHSGAAGSGMPQWYLYWTNTTTGTVTQQVLARLNTQLSNIRRSRTTTVSETINVKDYVFRSPSLTTGSYNIKIEYIVDGVNNFNVILNPDVNNVCSFEVSRVNQAADGKIMNIPQNMPNGTSGIRVIDFIRGLQKKFNLIIYPDKLNPNQFIVETFNNWYKQGEIKNFNQYINLRDKIEFIPANQLAYKQVRFSDETDNDYITTLFKRQYNRTFGESNFYDSGSYYSQGELEVIANTLASGPLGRIPGSSVSGSASNATCSTYRFYNPSSIINATTAYVDCNGDSQFLVIPIGRTVEICAQSISNVYNPGDPSLPVEVTKVGNCTPGTAGSFYPVWIPYYISNAEYSPARVLPRLLFYNGTIPATSYFIQGYYADDTGSLDPTFIINYQQSLYPYFDNYSTGSLNGTASLFPQENARSLLFNNEEPVLGTMPSQSLVSEYWDKYLALLYNPRTRLVNASAVIPLADYFGLELNDIAEFRGNYYHLRAINDYNLTTGECNIQMLGPIISDTISGMLSGSWAPTSDPCAFTYSVGFEGCATWNSTNNTWEQEPQLWNCS
jgi:hypothetical protein